jgi:membrane-associated phospholipid phosphatase
MSVGEVFGRLTSPRTVVPASWLTAALMYRRPGGVEIAIGTSAAVLAADLVKPLVSRRRPRVWTGTPWRSFPSGHGAAWAGYLGGLALAAPRAYRALALGAACLGVAAVDALRVSTGEHWTSDVLAGDLLGVAGIAGAHLLHRAVTVERTTARAEDARRAAA